jgi:hypothetical protein
VAWLLCATSGRPAETVAGDEPAVRITHSGSAICRRWRVIADVHPTNESDAAAARRARQLRETRDSISCGENGQCSSQRSRQARKVPDSRHIGLIGGLGAGAALIYYRAIAASLADRGTVPRITIVHAHAPTALAHATAGRIDELADFAGFVAELRSVGDTAWRISATSADQLCTATFPPPRSVCERLWMTMADGVLITIE